MVINKFDILRAQCRRHKANTELIVDTNPVLAISIADERFQPIARRHPQKVEYRGGIQLIDFPSRDGFDIDESLDAFPQKKFFRVCALESLYRYAI